MKDTAYTSLALPAHTDTTYFTDPAGLQMFHLLSHTDGTGGTSLLVDGFKAAKTLLKEDRSAYKTLTGFYMTAHASGNEGITITPAERFAVIEGPGRSVDNVTRIRWNNDDRAAVPLNDRTELWYRAARKFNEILKRKDMEYWAQLEPGRPLSMYFPQNDMPLLQFYRPIIPLETNVSNAIPVFDNWRVLHGRSSFTGKRRICGGYSKLIFIPPTTTLDSPSPHLPSSFSRTISLYMPSFQHSSFFHPYHPSQLSIFYSSQPHQSPLRFPLSNPPKCHQRLTRFPTNPLYQ